ncbi:MAG: ATP-binding protein [Bacteroidales bacterium]|nr:ATP-binding protein [Bacteroidales bacterium]
MNKLQFKISAALKNIIGRDLITDDFIAVFELVKNSYDAYASEVKIIFEDDRIIISDNGKGMSFQDLQDKWLFLAYSAKKEEKEDNSIKDDADYRDKIQAKRYFAGAKGIGRFSCDRLGNELILTTRKDKTDKVEQLHVKWDDFNNSEDEFINISVSHETLPVSNFPNLQKGTVLEISHLNSEWSRKKLLGLKHSLEKLINPFESNAQFEIKISCETELYEDNNGVYKSGATERKGKKYSERDKVNGSVNNFIFEKLEVKTTQIITHIGKDGIITELIDRGELIYKIKEPNTKYNYLENVNFNIFYLTIVR